MKFGNVSTPWPIIEATRSGKLMIFAGAGVSMQSPTCLPDFSALTSKIFDNLAPSLGVQQTQTDNSFERELEELATHGGDVWSECARVIGADKPPSLLHENILRLYGPNRKPCIVTTNFDSCFEKAGDKVGVSFPAFVGPALPLGDNFSGLVHLHGWVNDPHSQVLTASDLGKAYISNGWAARFLVSAFASHVTLFVGYSGKDTLVDYLTRSLSSDMKEKAFTLIEDGEDQSEWLGRGVTPLSFKCFEDLPTFFEDLSSFVSMPIYERAGQVSDLASSTEPLLPIDSDHLFHDLNDLDNDCRLACTRAFINSATSTEMLRWAYNNGILEGLFKPRKDSCSRQLARWAIDRYAIAQPEQFGLIVLRNQNGALSRDATSWLISAITQDGVPEEITAFWVSLLQGPIGAWDKLRLADIAQHIKSPHAMLLVLQAILRVNPTLEKTYFPKFGDTLAPTLGFLEGVSMLDKISNTILPLMGAIALPLWSYCIGQIEIAYALERHGASDANIFDSLSYMRSAIEPHSQNPAPETGVYCLVDVARMAGEELVASQGIQGHRLIASCLDSPYSLIKRLGLHLLGQSSMSPEAVVKNVIDHDVLSNIYCKHEAFLLLAHTYPHVSDATRDSFCQYARQAYAQADDELNNTYNIFNLFSWLKRFDFKDERLSQGIYGALRKYPYFEEREHPDLNHYSCGVENMEIVPLAKEQFSYKDIRCLIDNYQPGSTHPLDRLPSTAAKYPDKIFDVVSDCLSGERDESDIGIANSLLHSMDINSASRATRRAFIDTFITATHVPECLQSALASTERIMADDLFDATEDERNILVETALTTWKQCLAVPLALEAKDGMSDWMLQGLNHPLGSIISIASYDISRKLLHDIDPTAETNKLMSLAEDAFSRTSNQGKVVAASLFSHFSLWMLACKETVGTELLPLLDSHCTYHIAAWQGLSHMGRVDQQVWNIIKQPLIDAMSSGQLGDSQLAITLISLFSRCSLRYDSDMNRKADFLRCINKTPARCEHALGHIWYWLDSLDDGARLSAWSQWLSSLMQSLVTCSEPLKECTCCKLLTWIQNGSNLSSQFTRLLLEHPFSSKGYVPLDVKKIKCVLVSGALSPDDSILLLAQIIRLDTYTTFTLDDVCEIIHARQQSTCSIAARTQLLDALSIAGERCSWDDFINVH